MKKYWVYIEEDERFTQVTENKINLNWKYSPKDMAHVSYKRDTKYCYYGETFDECYNKVIRPLLKQKEELEKALNKTNEKLDFFKEMKLSKGKKS